MGCEIKLINQHLFYILVFGVPVRSNSVLKKPSVSRYSVFWRGANILFQPPPHLQMGGGKGIQKTGILVEF